MSNTNFDEISKIVSNRISTKLNKYIPKNLDKAEIDYIKGVIVELALNISIEVIKEYDKIKNTNL